MATSIVTLILRILLAVGLLLAGALAGAAVGFFLMLSYAICCANTDQFGALYSLGAVAGGLVGAVIAWLRRSERRAAAT